jgi:hypothetical protein
VAIYYRTSPALVWAMTRFPRACAPLGKLLRSIIGRLWFDGDEKGAQP